MELLTGSSISGVELLPGYLITGSKTAVVDRMVTKGSSSRGSRMKERETETRDIWTGRDLEDADAFTEALIKSIESRLVKCINPDLISLNKCLDLHGLVSHLCGSKTSSIPYDEVKLAQQGTSEFTELVEFLAQHPSIQKSRNVRFHKDLAGKIYDKVKEGLASVIWGNKFQIVGASLFSVVDGPMKGKVLADLPGDAHVTELSIVET